MTTALCTRAAAKLNLTLEVQGRRPDGFHNLASVATSLDLADELRFSPADVRRISYVDDSGRPASILTDDDIIVRAWDELERRTGRRRGGEIQVVKRIPISGGLGGGSTDAAAFLRVAQVAWDLPLSDEELSEIGAEVGSDVPACLTGGMVRMDGRGERITPLDVPASALAGWSAFIFSPEIPVPQAKTATMYGSLRASDWRSGEATDALAAALARGRPPVQEDCVNSFDSVAREVMQGLTAGWRRMGAAVGWACHYARVDSPIPLLAGAGPSMFAIVPSQIAAAALDDLRSGGFVYAARPLSRKDALAVWEC